MFQKAYIDPRSTVNYSSYYIKGLYDMLGKKNVHFASEYFSELKDIDILMAFVLIDGDSIIKIIIDYRDQNDVIKDAISWSDFYAKINIDANTRQHPQSHKLINIPPGFAIRIWSPMELLYNLCNNFVKGKIIKHINDKNIHLRPKRWIRNYLTLIKRQTLEQYTTGQDTEDDNYVFFVSTLWPDQDSVNNNRFHFMFTCEKNPLINFEGGFFINSHEWKSTPVPNSIPQKLLYYKFLSNKIYLKKIKKSLFVLNTPAVHNCHGWKLGEFLCMGKAIISTPLVNELPIPLEHNKHIFFVKNKQDIENAVTLLLENKDFRCQLEKNAELYYNNYASPARVIESIIQKIK